MNGTIKRLVDAFLASIEVAVAKTRGFAGQLEGAKCAAWPCSSSFHGTVSNKLASCFRREPPSSAVKMAEYKPQAVKDVPANDFIKAYAAHLKSTDKVCAGWSVCSHITQPLTAAAFWEPGRAWGSRGVVLAICGALWQPHGRGCAQAASAADTAAGSVEAHTGNNSSRWRGCSPAAPSDRLQLRCVADP